MINDTICAIATSLNTASIGIIRLSGDDAVVIADKVYKGKKSLTEVSSHTINYGHIVDNDNIIDEVLVSVMLAPKSYTTENVVEINCHGGVFILKKVLKLLLDNGARLAEPGEFTKRAFMNGRIDLSEAEAVMKLIASDNETARKNSIKQLSGCLYNEISEIREKILHETAFIEAALDDPEHYDLINYPHNLHNNLQVINNIVDKYIKSYENGAVYSEGINTAIVGKPNAGKSSIMNLLTNSKKAIVTDIAGTTRDAIEQNIILGGLSINLIDTAGIRDASDVVEKIGVDKSLEYIDDAMLILYVVDSSVPLDDNDLSIIERLQDKKVIILLNKSDLSTVVSKDDINEKIKAEVISFNANVFDIDGINKLAELINKMFLEGQINSDDQIFITSERQRQCLIDCNESLKKVMQSIDDGMPEDFFTIDLMDAYISLGLITGESVDDDLADKIFKEFCMGK